jgi:hypothetical protein
MRVGSRTLNVIRNPKDGSEMGHGRLHLSRTCGGKIWASCTCNGRATSHYGTLDSVNGIDVFDVEAALSVVECAWASDLNVVLRCHKKPCPVSFRKCLCATPQTEGT